MRRAPANHLPPRGHDSGAKTLPVFTDISLRLHRHAAEREAQIVAEEKALVAKLAQLQAHVAQCQQALARKGSELVQSERHGSMVHVAVLVGPQLATMVSSDCI